MRKSLVEGGDAAVSASTDPLVVLARNVDPFFRETRKQYEDSVESVVTGAIKDRQGAVCNLRKVRVSGRDVYAPSGLRYG